MLTRNSKSLVPRYSLPAYHRTKVEGTSDADDGFDNTTYSSWSIVCEEAKWCTLDKASAYSTNVDISGLSSQEVFVLRTATPLYQPEDGSQFLGSGVYIPDVWWGYTTSAISVPSKGGWYNVISCQPYLNGVQSHYECIIEKDNSVDEDSYPTSILANTDTLWVERSDFLDESVWSDTWTHTETIDDDNVHTIS